VSGGFVAAGLATGGLGSGLGAVDSVIGGAGGASAAGSGAGAGCGTAGTAAGAGTVTGSALITGAGGVYGEGVWVSAAVVVG